MNDIISTSEETCIVELSSDSTDFRVTAVKLYLQELDISIDISINSTNEPQIKQDTSRGIEQDTPLEINEMRRNSSRYQ